MVPCASHLASFSLAASASNTSIKVLPIILRFCSGSLTPAKRDKNISSASTRTTLTPMFCVIDINSIIATDGAVQAVLKGNPRYTPPLNNKALFRRDDHLCLYCGERFSEKLLSRDHV